MKTIFNPSTKNELTYSESLGPAMEITEQEDANQYFKDYIEFMMTHSNASQEKAIETAKINLGYYAGYYSEETRERVERLFNCAHPFFGKITVNGRPLPETAFNIGQAIGKQL